MSQSGLQLRSLVKSSGDLVLSLESVPVPQPAAHEVVIRVDAAPINPSDQGLLFGAADLSTLVASGTRERPVVTAKIPAAALRAMTGRLDQSMPAGNEGAGLVVAAGSSPEAQALLGKTVAALGGAMYSQFRAVPAESCLVLPAGATAADGASAFVNPLTALGMTETMRREGRKALVHTAAASALGQMLQRLCLADGIPLVNIVRRKDHAQLLRGLGAEHVIDQSAPSFAEDLAEACAKTGATLAFDATGGGKLASQILTAMEAALTRGATQYSRYGSSTHKQVYIYGGLDTGPTELSRNFGMSWGLGGWLVFPFLQKIGSARVGELKARVARDLKTIFATSYAKELSLAQALAPEEIRAYGQRATSGKVLLRPNA